MFDSALSLIVHISNRLSLLFFRSILLLRQAFQERRRGRIQSSGGKERRGNDQNHQRQVRGIRETGGSRESQEVAEEAKHGLLHRMLSRHGRRPQLRFRRRGGFHQDGPGTAVISLSSEMETVTRLSQVTNAQVMLRSLSFLVAPPSEFR